MDILKRIFNYSARYRKQFVFAIILVMMLIGINLVTPLISRVIVDDVVKGGQRELLPLLMAALLMASLVRSATVYLRGLLLENYSQNCLYDLRNDMYTHLQHLPFSFYDDNRIGELMSRMTGDLEGIRMFLASGIPVLLENAIYFFGTVIILLNLNAKLAVVTMIIIPSIAYLAFLYNKVIRPKYSEIREQHAALNTAAQENIAGVRVVKAFAREDHEIRKFEVENRKNQDLNIEASRISSRFFPLMDFITSICLVILVYVGGRMVGRGEITVGTVVAFNGYLWMLIMPMRMLGWIVNMMTQAITSGKRVFDILDTGSSIKEKENPYDPEHFRGEVTFENVSFRFRRQMVLEDISFHAPTGSTIAIMGATGTGKTSIINLIARFYDRVSGTICIDGVDVKDWKLSRLRSEIGFIMQETFLFSDTIEGNIRFGKPDATWEEVVEAAKIADAHDFIMEMPEGYNTIIGERGTGLSGGQKQRIAIARAVIKNPAILIMDDCTSAVDMETEHKIQQALDKVRRNRTTFIIAHRVSSVRKADEILILDGGRIVERGNHEELMALKGRYYEMVKQQYKDLDTLDWREMGTNESVKEHVKQKEKVV
ncbi:MAG: ABC transporter ATP-binding protein [Caldicoprobacterales bacterium]|nr:ABC transporter ATP-binding protein [Clostridiales bacterium]